MADGTRTKNREPHQGRGREAEKPRDIPRQGIKDVLVRVKNEQTADNLSLIAAGVAFYGMLAIFPALAALISIYGIFANPGEVQQQISQFSGMLPSQAQDLITQELNRIVSNSSGALSLGIAGGILISLWSATKGMKALMISLNIVYDEDETRGFFKKNALALLFTLIGIIAVIFSLAIITIIPPLLQNLSLPGFMSWVISVGRWILMAFFVILALGFLYMYIPNRDHPRWRWVTWGSVTATALWIVASFLFSFYVSNFGSYNKTYGSVGAIIILLMWFFITAYAILLGGEINSELEHQTRKDTTRGEPRPMGRRGAHHADTLGEKH